MPRHEFKQLATTVDPKRRSDAISRWDQFVTMATVQLTGRSSLRDVEYTLKQQRHLHYHSGAKIPSRSALSRANQSLSADFYEQLFTILYQRCRLAAPTDNSAKFKLPGKLFSLDASLIDVSLKLFPQANFNTMKAAYKLHVGLDHDGLIPAFATLTGGKVSDMNQARQFSFPKGSTVVVDRGYNDFGWHNSLTEQGVFFVTRIRGNALFDVIETQDTADSPHVISDQWIRYTGKNAVRRQLKPVRLVTYKDPDTEKTYRFITNHSEWDSQTVADLYEQRWQVELFFKWIKQNLKIKAFLGHSENAVRTQVLIALCIYLILSFIRFLSKTKWSLQQFIRLVHTNLFARRPLELLLKPPERNSETSPQLTFWRPC